MINIRQGLVDIYSLKEGEKVNISTASMAKTMGDIQVCYQIRKNLRNIYPKLSNSINISRWYDKGLSGIVLSRVEVSENVKEPKLLTEVKHNSIDKWMSQKGDESHIDHQCPDCGAEQKGDWAVWCWLCGRPRNGQKTTE